MTKQTLPQPLPLDSTHFTSNGNKYNFYLDTMGFERLVEFLTLVPVINLGMTMVNVHKLLEQIFIMIKDIKLNSFLEDVYKIRQLLFNALKKFEDTPVQKLTTSQIEAVYRLCALFLLNLALGGHPMSCPFSSRWMSLNLSATRLFK